MMNNRSFLFFLALNLLFLSCSTNLNKGISDNNDLQNREPFEIRILDQNYSMGYSILTILTEKDLKIILKSDTVGQEDKLVFSKSLRNSITLQEISNTNIDSLNNFYSNDCIRDGSQLTIVFRKSGKAKSIRLSNYYQDDIGKLINQVNYLVPKKYKIWYDKETLIDDYKRCN